MDQSNASAFSFGSVQDTFYENVNQQVQIGKLPYNPFLFDLSIVIKKSEQGYQLQGHQIQLNNSCMNIFGRKAKKHKQDELANSLVIRHQFLAETISKSHFSIDINHHLLDLGSKKGTYIWLHRNQPKLLQVGDQFLLNNQESIKVNSINQSSQKMELQVSEHKTLTLNPKLFKERLFLMGSNSKCHFINPKLEQFHLGIDLLGMMIHNLIQDQDCEHNKGTWMKVKQAVKIEGGDLILAFPYVLEVKY